MVNYTLQWQDIVQDGAGLTLLCGAWLFLFPDCGFACQLVLLSGGEAVQDEEVARTPPPSPTEKFSPGTLWMLYMCCLFLICRGS